MAQASNAKFAVGHCWLRFGLIFGLAPALRMQMPNYRRMEYSRTPYVSCSVRLAALELSASRLSHVELPLPVERRRRA